MAGEGIAILNSSFQITHWNKEFIKIIGKHEEFIKKNNLADLFKEFSCNLEQKNNNITPNFNQAQCLVLFFSSKGYFSASVIPLFIDKSTTAGGVCILRKLADSEEINSFEEVKQMEVLNAIFQTQEEERKRIAETLHSSLGQLLYATKLKIESFNQNISNEKFLSLKKEVDKLLVEAIEETRTLSFQLIPKLLEEHGIKEALQELIKKVSQPNLPIELNIKGFQQRLDQKVEMAVFRITQELINNVLKHSKAKKAVISLSSVKEKILIQVSDNGDGFNVNELDDSRLGLGLRSIKNKLKLLNGAMDIKSQPGLGTSITINIKSND